jgi:hypothetical protein
MSSNEIEEWELAAEEWRPVADYEGLYDVSNLGRVRRHYATKPTRVLDGFVDPFGYRYVGLSNTVRNRKTRVAALVAAAFIGPRPWGYHVCHLDGSKDNDRASNLVWGTRLTSSCTGPRRSASKTIKLS